jgi:hypothetical protein
MGVILSLRALASSPLPHNGSGEPVRAASYKLFSSEFAVLGENA